MFALSNTRTYTYAHAQYKRKHKHKHKHKRKPKDTHLLSFQKKILFNLSCYHRLPSNTTARLRKIPKSLSLIALIHRRPSMSKHDDYSSTNNVPISGTSVIGPISLRHPLMTRVVFVPPLPKLNRKWHSIRHG